MSTYRGEQKGMQILLSRTQARPCRVVKQDQEKNSRNHVHAFSEYFFLRGCMKLALAAIGSHDVRLMQPLRDSFVLLSILDIFLPKSQREKFSTDSFTFPAHSVFLESALKRC